MQNDLLSRLLFMAASGEFRLEIAHAVSGKNKFVRFYLKHGELTHRFNLEAEAVKRYAAEDQHPFTAQEALQVLAAISALSPQAFYPEAKKSKLESKKLLNDWYAPQQKRFERKL